MVAAVHHQGAGRHHVGLNHIGEYLIEGDEGAFQLGIDKGWGPAFGARVSFACAVAKIRDPRQGATDEGGPARVFVLSQ